MRYAIWAAVSSKPQASEDKASLPSQVDRCRQAGEAHGWTETAGPFIVPGKSRTRLISLRDAEAAIPELHAMLNAAQQRRFDVLITVDLNRFRDLMDQVFLALAGYGVQLYALQTPLEPVPPDRYSIEAAQTARQLVGINMITSSAEITQIRLKYRNGLPLRIRSGLPFQLPYGYTYHRTGKRNEDRLAVPQPVSTETSVLLDMKDRLLAGQSTRQIIDSLHARGIPGPSGGVWHPQTVRDLLRNPFYAGQVRFGVSSILRDTRTGTTRKLRRGIPTESATGKHTPLWDLETHQRILGEIRRRSKNYRGRSNNQFTGLMKCGSCGASLWMNYNGPRGEQRAIWRCSKDRTHLALPHVEAIRQVGQLLVKSLPAYTGKIRKAGRAPAAVDPLAELNELRKERQRLEVGYLKGGFDFDSYMGYVRSLDGRIQEAQAKLQRQASTDRQRRDWLDKLQALQELAGDLPAWLATEDPGKVNLIMNYLLEKIELTPAGILVLYFKE
jgi:hypothetical protein